MKSLVLLVYLAVSTSASAIRNARIEGPPSGDVVIEGPSAKASINGPDGSHIDSFTPGGKIIAHSQHGGIITASDDGSASVIGPEGPTVTAQGSAPQVYSQPGASGSGFGNDDCEPSGPGQHAPYPAASSPFSASVPAPGGPSPAASYFSPGGPSNAPSYSGSGEPSHAPSYSGPGGPSPAGSYSGPGGPSPASSYSGSGGSSHAASYYNPGIPSSPGSYSNPGASSSAGSYSNNGIAPGSPGSQSAPGAGSYYHPSPPAVYSGAASSPVDNAIPSGPRDVKITGPSGIIETHGESAVVAHSSGVTSSSDTGYNGSGGPASGEYVPDNNEQRYDDGSYRSEHQVGEKNCECQ